MPNVGSYPIVSPAAGSWALHVTSGLGLKRVPIAEAGVLTGDYGNTPTRGGVRTIREVNGTGSFIAADNGCIVEANAAADLTLTIPKDTFTVGATIEVVWKGVGQPLIAPATDVTLNSAGGLRRIANRYDMIYMYMSEPNVWIMTGNLIT